MTNITINNATPSVQRSGNPLSSSFGRILTIVFWLIILGLLVAGVFIAYSTISNWGYISSFFTTGFIGWLNPFDDPDGDQNPIYKVGEKMGLTKTQNALVGALDGALDAVQNE